MFGVGVVINVGKDSVVVNMVVSVIIMFGWGIVVRECLRGFVLS